MSEVLPRRAELLALHTKLSSIGTVTAQMSLAIEGLPLRLATVAKGEPIARDGEVVHHSCLLLEGMLHRTKTTANGGRQILSIHVPGDIPDLHSLHLSKMDHSLVATIQSNVAFIAHADIKKAITQSPPLNDLFWRETLIDAASFRAWMIMLGQTDSMARVSHVLCELYVRLSMVGRISDNGFDFPLTQSDLADVVGTSPVHVNRVLQKMRALNIVVLEDRRVTVPSWHALREIAQFEPAYLHYLNQKAGIERPKPQWMPPKA